MGRITLHSEYDTSTSGVYERTAVYDAGNEVTSDVVVIVRGGSEYGTATSYSYVDSSGQWQSGAVTTVGYNVIGNVTAKGSVGTYAYDIFDSERWPDGLCDAA